MKKLKPLLFPVILVFLVFAVYVNSLNNGFVSDDIPGVVLTGASWTWRSVFTDIRFLTRWTGILQFFLYQLVGLSPWAYRLVNIICHALSVVLVYKIVFQLSSRSKHLSFYASNPLFLAFFSASLFAVHPIIVESVTWISGGVYVHYGMLFLLSFWLYIRNRGQRTEDRGRKFDRFFPLSAFCLPLSYFIFTLSLFFSEKAAVLFLFFFLYEWCYGNLKKSWRTLMPYFIVSCIFMLFYITQLNSRIASVSQVSGGGEGGMYNPLIQLPIALFSYFYLIVWPKDLTLYHSEIAFSMINYIIRLLVFFGYSAGIIVTAIKNRKLCFWLVWFLIPLLPTLTPFKIAWLVAERYAYLSVIGIFVCIAYGFEAVFQYAGPATIVSRKRPHGRGNAVEFLFSRMAIGYKSSTLLTVVRYCGRLRDALVRVTRFLRNFFTLPARLDISFFSVVIFFIVLIAFSLRTIIRNRDWQNEDTLWIATAKTSPSIPYTWNNMGDVYSRHGDYKKAAEMFQRAIVLNPQYADAYHNLAETKRDMGEIGDAILMYEKAIVLNPKLWQSHQALAGIYVYKKEYQKALYHIEEALKIVPENQMLQKVRMQLRKE